MLDNNSIDNNSMGKHCGRVLHPHCDCVNSDSLRARNEWYCQACAICNKSLVYKLNSLAWIPNKKKNSTRNGCRWCRGQAGHLEDEEERGGGCRKST